MVVLDEDFGTGLTLVEGNGGVRLSPVSVPERAPRDWRSQCERERARADAAEARAEELRWAEVAARSDGGSWKSRFWGRANGFLDLTIQWRQPLPTRGRTAARHRPDPSTS